jgi:hypothetical protein
VTKIAYHSKNKFGRARGARFLLVHWGMVKFNATLKYNSSEGTTGKWSFETKVEPGCAGPNDADLVWLLRHIADRIESDAKKKLN